MNYELAKKLKDAGFPQSQHIGGNGRTLFEDTPKVSEEEILEDAVNETLKWQAYCPTLEELIEACGNDIATLDRVTMGWRASGSIVDTEMGYKGVDAFGSTPEEAIANLWLVLNEK